MTDPLISPIQVPAADQLCFSLKEFGQAMGEAQGHTVASAGQAMQIFFFVGLIIGCIGMYVWLRSKDKIDELTQEEQD